MEWNQIHFHFYIWYVKELEMAHYLGNSITLNKVKFISLSLGIKSFQRPWESSANSVPHLNSVPTSPMHFATSIFTNARIRHNWRRWFLFCREMKLAKGIVSWSLVTSSVFSHTASTTWKSSRPYCFALATICVALTIVLEQLNHLRLHSWKSEVEGLKGWVDIHHL